MHFCEFWEFLASSAILLRMAPRGAPRLAAIFQEAAGLCALRKTQRIEGKGMVTNRMDIRNLVILLSLYWWETWWVKKWNDLQTTARNKLETQVGLKFFILIMTFPSWDFIQYLSRMFAKKKLFLDHRSLLHHRPSLRNSGCVWVPPASWHFKNFSPFLLEIFSLEPSPRVGSCLELCALETDGEHYCWEWNGKDMASFFLLIIVFAIISIP